jgi:ABC-type glycerol-3-phosphate transport system substrate-binding protein
MSASRPRITAALVLGAALALAGCSSSSSSASQPSAGISAIASSPPAAHHTASAAALAARLEVAGPRTVTPADVEHFAEFTGDTFYAHMDEDAARANPFFDGRGPTAT